MRERLKGLIAAAYTPLRADESVDRQRVPIFVDWLLANGVAGLYVCGSTGEGMSLTSAERREVAESFVAAVDDRVPVIVQVGHNSLAEARELAAHAQTIGASAISATSPSYYPMRGVDELIESMAFVASGAPETAFYYYHIPILTRIDVDMLGFLQRAVDRIPTLAGLKDTGHALHHFQRCLEWEDSRVDVVWGQDETLLGALAVGARAGIGSTYNIAAPLYNRLIAAFERGDLVVARREQARAVEMVQAIARYPFHAAMKEVLRMLEMPCGPCRLPQARLADHEIEALRASLDSIGFFEWRS